MGGSRREAGKNIGDSSRRGAVGTLMLWWGELPVFCVDEPDPKTAANWASEVKAAVEVGAAETVALPASETHADHCLLRY